MQIEEVSVVQDGNGKARPARHTLSENASKFSARPTRKYPWGTLISDFKGSFYV
jgi:hypothetical protein